MSQESLKMRILNVKLEGAYLTFAQTDKKHEGNND